LGQQVEKAKITGFIDLTKPHLRKVLRREGDNEIKGKVSPGPKGFNTLALAFEKAMEEDVNKGLRTAPVHRRRARR